MGLFVQNMGHHLLIIKQPIVFSDFQVGDFQDCLQMLVYFTLSRHKGWAYRSPICGTLGKSMISTAGNPSMYPASEIWHEHMYVMMIPGGSSYDAKLNVATVHIALLSQLEHCTGLPESPNDALIPLTIRVHNWCFRTTGCPYSSSIPFLHSLRGAWVKLVSLKEGVNCEPSPSSDSPHPLRISSAVIIIKCAWKLLDRAKAGEWNILPWLQNFWLTIWRLLPAAG